MASTFAVDGIISGLKTSDIISQLMALEQRPLDALQSKKTLEQQRKSALQEINTKLISLQSLAQRLTLRSTVNAKTATTDTPSSLAPVLTATASADAANGSFQVTVSQLATATRVSSATAIGQAIRLDQPLASAGFNLTPVAGTFTINGVAVTIDDTTILSDGVDAPGSNTAIARINDAGAGVTASIVNDDSGRPNRIQLTSSAGRGIQLGAGADTSNFLRIANLQGSRVVGDTAASVTGAAVSAGALGATEITINGVTVTTTATNPGNTAAQNAASLAADINNLAGSTVMAVGNPDGTITLTQKTAGSAAAINITTTGVGTGLAAGSTANGTDRLVSSSNLGTASPGALLSNAQLAIPVAGFDADGNGKLRINGVDITYRASDTLNSVISRINSSGAGVTAFYDSVQDRVRLTSGSTGDQLISLEDVTGNFLAATGLLGTTQSVGRNALFSIDSVNGGEVLSSSSNTVTGYVPGVTLELKQASATPVTVTVGQDQSATVKAVKDFVDQFNAVMDTIATQTKYDTSLKQSAPLTGDSTVRSIASLLRTMVSSSALGVSGVYQSLADLGIGTGAIGAKPGTATKLVLDESKLTKALQDNPAAVESVFAGFSSTAALGAGGTGSVLSISGTSTTQHQPGTYAITSDGAGNLSAVFTPTGGTAQPAVAGIIAAGGTNTTLIPGVTLTAKAVLAAGTDTIDLSVQTRGVAVRLNDYLKDLIATDGVIQAREDESDNMMKDIDAQVQKMQDRLSLREETLQKKFSALEVALSRMQQQSSGVLAQLAALTAPAR